MLDAPGTRSSLLLLVLAVLASPAPGQSTDVPCEPCDCGSAEAVYGRVIYDRVREVFEYTLDGIDSDCCFESLVGGGCSDTPCSDTVIAVEPSCGVMWDAHCAQLARELCGTHCLWRHSSAFVRGLTEGEPVPHVTVDLIGSIGCNGLNGNVDSTLTDLNGCFCLCVGGFLCDTPNTIRVVAKNDRVTVKASKAVPLATDKAIRVDFDIDDSVYGSGDVEYDIGLDDRIDTFDSWGASWPVSRAMHVCRAAHMSAEHIEEIFENLVTVDALQVRLGWTGTAWYNAYLTLGQTIHLPANQTETMWHEYGHHLENRLGAFGVIPSYIFLGGHAYCCEQETTASNYDYCWAFLEGVATWYAAVNSHGFRDVDGLGFYGAPTAWNRAGELRTFGRFPDIENNRCGPWGGGFDQANPGCDDGATDPNWAEPRSVEAVTAHVLWDLIDDHVDPNDTHQTGVPEVAEIDIQEVLAVITASSGYSSNCNWVTTYTHPVSLYDFCEEYKRQHANDTPHGVFPDLYAALAFNFADWPCARDVAPPEAAVVTSPSHPEGVWVNSAQVAITVTDGPDDMSGSYYYRNRWESVADFEMPLWGVNSPDFCSKSWRNCTPIVDRCDDPPGSPAEACSGSPAWTMPDVHEGDDNYYHLQTIDMAGHLGPQTTYGPVLIDITSPEFVTNPVFPGAGVPHPIGSFVRLEWDTLDQCPPAPDCNDLPQNCPRDPSCTAFSGVSHIEIRYTDGITQIVYPPIYEPAGVKEIYLDADEYSETLFGEFSIEVFDVAGNSYLESSQQLTIIRPFEGPSALGLDISLAGLTVVSGDLNHDGSDEVVLVDIFSGPPALRSVTIWPAESTEYIDPGPLDGDLFLADTDRDGDLDLIAAGDYGPIGGPPDYRIKHYRRDPSGFSAIGSLPVLALADYVVRVVDLYGNGEPILIYMGVGSSGAPRIGTYNFATGATTTSLPSVQPVIGDFEVADVDADGYFDLVLAGTQNSGQAGVFHYEGTASGWLKHVVKHEAYMGRIDIDLGNWDDDRTSELYIMHDTTAPPNADRIATLYELNGGRFERAIPVSEDGFLSRGAGNIVDIYNDGLADVFAMGRTGAVGYQLSHNLIEVHGSVLPPTPGNFVRYDCDIAWGDFNADASIEPCVVGRANGSGLHVVDFYENQMSVYGAPNGAPNPPRNLAAERDDARGGYVFSWQAPEDTIFTGDETANIALGYELRVGTNPLGPPGSGQGNEIVSWAHLAGPTQQVAAQSYSSLTGDRFERFVPLPAGTYYWSVRTVDSGWRRSVAAVEQLTDPTPEPNCASFVGDCDLDLVPDACEVDTDHDGLIDDCDADDDNDGVPDVVDTDPLDPYRCQDSDGDGCDDCRTGVDGFGSLSDVLPNNDGLDSDGDGLCDSGDPCPGDNPNDSDADGICDSVDACPGFPDGLDSDGDGVADGCDLCPSDAVDDSDGDGICDSADVCPGGDDLIDTDRDGTPDFCDTCPASATGDTDGDGVCDDADLCRGFDDFSDSDGDGIPDGCDGCPLDVLNDSDFDGTCDSVDICPGGDDFADANGNGVPDDCDDCNGNGVPDVIDIAVGTSLDCGANGTPDECEADTDGDGLVDSCDPCVSGAGSGDADGDGVLSGTDLPLLGGCLSGPDGSGGGGCECFDFDSDGDSDMRDFVAYQQIVE